MKKVFASFLKKLLKLTRMDKGSIVIIEESFPSGSNTRILYDYLYKCNDYKLIYIDFRTDSSFEKLKYLYIISKAEIIVSTHAFQKLKKSQVCINLWHGTPMKSMNYMEENVPKYRNFPDDYLVTNSKLDSILLSSCMHIPYKKHRVYGSPRLDYFSKISNNLEIGRRLDGYEEIIIYLPTFREGHGRNEGLKTNELFNLDIVNYEELEQFLESKNYLLITKYHPYEVDSINYDFKSSKHIYNLSNEDLVKNDIDLYELLPLTSMLITDYSSVYIDYLLLDKPIIFVDSDLEHYRSTRGLLLEPYEQWTPGSKVRTQDELQMQIQNQLSQDEFNNERFKLKELFFQKNNISNSCSNVKILIDENLKKH